MPVIYTMTVALIVPFHKSHDTLLHPGHNDQIQNTLFIELPRVTQGLNLRGKTFAVGDFLQANRHIRQNCV